MVSGEAFSSGAVVPDVVACVAAGLLGSVRRVAAAGGRRLVEISNPVEAVEHWSDSAFIILDAPAAARLAGRVPRRDGVAIVSSGAPAMAQWRRATEIGAQHVLGLPAEEAALVGALAGSRLASAAGGGDVVAVLGGCGGAGASVFAAALALTASRRGREALLVDADPGGCGLDALLGIEQQPGLRWPQLKIDSGAVTGEALRAALPGIDGARVLSFHPQLGEAAGDEPPSASALRSVLGAARGRRDLAVCDAGRSLGDAAQAATAEADLAIIVVPANFRAVLAAQSVARCAARHTRNLGVVVRGPAPGGLEAADVGRALALPVLAAMRPERALDAGLEERGLRLGKRSPLAAAASDILARLSSRARR